MSARKYVIKVTSQAQRDLRDIRLYSLQHWGSDRADAYDLAIDNALELLAEHPELGPLREDLRPGLRCLPVESHLVLYRILAKTIAIQRVIHRRRDLRRQFPSRRS